MHVLQVLPTRASSYGGPVTMVSLVHRALSERGHRSIVLPERPAYTVDFVGTTLYWPGLRGVAEISRSVRGADLVHVHGLWSLPTGVAGVAARGAGTPYVVTVHGMLSTWSLSRKPMRKRLYALLLERRHLRRASAVHVLSRDEIRAVRKWGIGAPVFRLPNAIDVNQFSELPRRDALDAQFPEARGRVALLFLGRLAKEKGVELLLSAFARACSDEDNLHLFIAGPGPHNTVESLTRLADQYSIGAHVTFTGEVRGNAKLRLLGGADLFVQLSHSEGDSVALKEAMASGLPLIVSKQAVTPSVMDSGGALVTERKPEVVAKAVTRLARDAARRVSMGESAREWARVHLDHRTFVEELAEVYEDILAGTRKSPRWC